MPYIWGAGLIYFGMNDQLLGMLIWCLVSVTYIWFKIRVIPELIKVIQIIWNMYSVLLGIKKQTEEMNEMVEMMTFHFSTMNRLTKEHI